MLEEYRKENFWKFYKPLPQDLKDALFAQETWDAVYEICDKYQLDSTEEIKDTVFKVLLGVLPLSDFDKTVGSIQGIDAEKIKTTSREIFRVIFYPVKSSLENLFSATQSSKTVQGATKEIQKETRKTIPEPKTAEKTKITAPVKKIAAKDSYREAVE